MAVSHGLMLVPTNIGICLVKIVHKLFENIIVDADTQQLTFGRDLVADIGPKCRSAQKRTFWFDIFKLL